MTESMQIELNELLRPLVSDRAISGETMLLNMGPQHPSTHGVLRLLLELDGEIVVNCIPDIGFLHTGIEKNIESKNYMQGETLTDRMDYMNSNGNNLNFSLAIEALTGLDVPPRAQGIRVIIAELTRLSSHLLWLGTSALDVGAMSLFLYAMHEREMILDIMEMVSGQRMMTTYIRPGGLWRDVPAGFETTLQQFIDLMPRQIDMYESLLTKNEIFLERTKNIGVLTPEEAIAWGVTGPMSRAAGIAYDVRKAHPYCGYEQYDFEIPTQTAGDVYARYQVRVAEMRQSVRIIQQALKALPYGPVRSTNHKFVPPPRSEIGVSMEALIHHFKIWTEGFKVPAGSTYVATESPHGELGTLMESDGSAKPMRVHYRTPSFAHLQVLPLLVKGHFVADVVAIVASIDIVLGDCDR